MMRLGRQLAKGTGNTGKKWGKTLDFELKSGADERT